MCLFIYTKLAVSSSLGCNIPRILFYRASFPNYFSKIIIKKNFIYYIYIAYFIYVIELLLIIGYIAFYNVFLYYGVISYNK